MIELLLLPFTIFWFIVGFFFQLLGRMITMILGIAMMLAGAILIFTLIGVFFGLPLLLLGFAFIIRALF